MRPEDRYIIHKCLNGDPAAFGILVDKYKASIYALAYSKLRNFHDAEDITQEAFTKAYQKLRTLRWWDDFPAWLYAITSNLCKNWIRSQSARPDRDFVADQDPDVIKRPSMDSYREGLMRESLHEALDSLPEIYRQALTLYYLGGMSTREIARFLRTSPNTIAQRLKRARAKLKEEMIAMMSTTFEEQRLQAGFTFRIVEAVKRIRIKPMPRLAELPWGLSLATGIIITVMSIGSHLSIINPMSTSMSSSLPNEAKVLKVGEISVDVLKISHIPFIPSKQGNGKGGEPEPMNPQNAFFMAPQGEGDTWTKKADMPTARAGLSTSVVSGKIYAIGGSIDGNSAIATVEEYDPAADKWIKKADMPTRRANLYTCVVNEKIYAIGGGWGGSALSTVEEYDPAEDRWIKKADMPTARCFLSGGVVDGKMYAIGGVRERETPLSVVEEYDPVADKWAKKADMPTARGMFATGAAGGKIFAIAGQDFDKNMGGWVWVSPVEEYDPKADKWTKKADIPTVRVGLSACAVNGRIYAIGGRSDTWVEVEEYDPAADTWTKKADMPTARWELSTSAVNGKIYAIGGCTPGNDTISTVEEYDTGFAGKSVDAKGKLAVVWGKIKSD